MSTLNLPWGVFVSNGEVFIADTYNHRVRKLLRNGQLTTIAGSINQNSQSTTLNEPYSVFVSSSDQVYISEWKGHKIKKIDRNGVISTIAGTGVKGYNYMVDGKQAVDAMLNNPCGLFVTEDEEVLIADSDNNRIRKIDRHGVITTIAGNGASGFDGDDKLATNASISMPKSVFQYKHEIYIADYENNRVRKIDRNGIISTIAGTGQRSYNGDGILATTANICPQYIYIHNDQIYISDLYNHRIRKIDQNGIITTIAGTGERGYYGDGQPAIKADLNCPTGIFVDTDAQVYIADTGNQCIRKIDQNGMISTIAGTPCHRGYSGDVPFDFSKYPHIGPRKKALIKPFPHAYHDIIICNSTWSE